MVSLTENEARTLEFLIRNFSEDYNINQLAKELNISPGGMLKILRKLKEQNFLKEKKKGNNVFYNINFDSHETLDACKFALSGNNASPYIKALMKDLEILKEEIELVIIFGSVLTKEKGAGDIDILFVFDKKDFKNVDNLISKLNKLRVKKIHGVYQTKKDLVENIRKEDKVILEAIKNGIVVWGRDVLVEVIKSGQN